MINSPRSVDALVLPPRLHRHSVLHQGAWRKLCPTGAGGRGEDRVRAPTKHLRQIDAFQSYQTHPSFSGNEQVQTDPSQKEVLLYRKCNLWVDIWMKFSNWRKVISVKSTLTCLWFYLRSRIVMHSVCLWNWIDHQPRLLIRGAIRLFLCCSQFELPSPFFATKILSLPSVFLVYMLFKNF